MWNIEKRVYADESEEIKILSRPTYSGKRKRHVSVPEGCRQLESIEESPFGVVKYEVLEGEELERDKIERVRAAIRSSRESSRRAREAVEVIGRANKWDWFLTLTFRDDSLGESYDVAAAALMRWLDAFRKRYPDAEYLLVMERGGQRGRWHAHALLRNASGLRVEYSHHKTRGGEPIFNIPLEYDLGFTTATRVRSSAAAGRYVAKYITKSLDGVPAGKKRYWASRSLKRLDDIRVTYLFDREDLDCLSAYLAEVCDRVSHVFVRAIDTHIAYYHLYGPVSGPASAAATVAPT